MLHSVYRVPGGAKLTGVGSIEHHRDLRVPNDETARWDNMDDDYILLAKVPNRIWDLYLFHERCWDRLIEHISPQEFDLGSLYKALEYLPLPPGSVVPFYSFYLT